MAVCLHHSKATGTCKVVLLGIANHDGDGGAWPTVRTLAKYARVHARNVQKALVKLQSLGELEVYYQEGGMANVADQDRPNLYRILVRCPVTCDGTTQHRDSREARRQGYQGKLPGMPNYPAPQPVHKGVAIAPPPDGIATGGGGAYARGGVAHTPPKPPHNHPDNTGGTATVTTGPDTSGWPSCTVCSQSAARCLSIPAPISGHSYTPPAGWRDVG
jgi:hypothetical protein